MRKLSRKESTYRGESPPKKCTRILAYEAARTLLRKDFTTCSFLCIPSIYAGDLSTLTAMGVCEHRIYCVDIDKHAIAAARRKYPNAHYHLGSFEEAFTAFPKLRANLGLAFLDLCAPLRAEGLGKILDFGRHARLLAFTSMYGREQGDLLAALNLKKDDAPKLPPRLRLIQRVPSKGMYFNAEHNWAYVSSSADHTGKPMFVSLGRMKFTQNPLLTFKQIEFSNREVRDVCMHNPDAHRLWNIAESTSIAWRAHESRGTYK